MKDKVTGADILPVTVFDAVKDSKGTSLSVVLQSMLERLLHLVDDEGFYVCDADGNIGMRYDADGLNVAQMSDAMNEQVYSYVKAQQQDVGNEIFPVKVTELAEWKFSKNASGDFADVTLPHSCNAADGQSASYYRGDTYYKYTLTVPVSGIGSKNYILLLKSAAQAGYVSVNGTVISIHKSGYTPFTVDLTGSLKAGSNEIMIKCSNQLDTTMPPVSSDFNKNNGLHDRVYLIESGKLHADMENYGYDKMHVFQKSVTDDCATVQVNTRIVNDTGTDRVCNVLISLSDSDGSIVSRDIETLLVPTTGMEYMKEITIDNPHLWNGLTDPYLYTVTLVISANSIVCENLSTKVGLRYYRMDAGTGFYLNGKSYPLRGVAHHQDLYGKASALTEADIDADFEFIKELGCNFIRIAHYPHNQYTFEKCDELGIIVQTEIPWVNECGVNATDVYLMNIKRQMKDMIIHHYNHPSIVFWGMWNELGNTHDNNPQGTLDVAKVVEWTEELYLYARNLDATRFIGMADDKQYNKPGWDMLAGDYHAENVYRGWYTNQSISGADEMKGVMMGIRNRMGCTALTEYGSGCNPYCHSEKPDTTTNKGSNGARHDEEYANLLHESHLRQICEMDFLVFTSAWVLFDFAVAARKEGYMHCTDGVTTTTDTSKYYINDKGLVTRDRGLKKDAFYLYKAKWNQKETTVYITSRRFISRPSSVITIKVYSNAETLRLYQNGVLKQTLTGSGEATGVIWTFQAIPFENVTDTFKVIGFDKNGVEFRDNVDFSVNK